MERAVAVPFNILIVVVCDYRETDICALSFVFAFPLAVAFSGVDVVFFALVYLGLAMILISFHFFVSFLYGKDIKKLCLIPLHYFAYSTITAAAFSVPIELSIHKS